MKEQWAQIFINSEPFTNLSYKTDLLRPSISLLINEGFYCSVSMTAFAPKKFILASSQDSHFQQRVADKDMSPQASFTAATSHIVRDSLPRLLLLSSLSVTLGVWYQHRVFNRLISPPQKP